ncbi:MAG: VRR-NUC domain-containing protein [Rhodocyclaceae bacterium]|nr:VRR-NUC domain-containing protein [Rhodocyclaceae bacterium]MCA3061836.1 VRR-NUC domain-containing protein [Rhodocyclaceae bacterium]MCA3081708.1 VRR-NUC domain-containing protein [Rhodocyclaceae bacterium]
MGITTNNLCFSLEPCRDATEGWEDSSRYQPQLFPSKWSKRAIGAYGIVPTEYFWHPDGEIPFSELLSAKELAQVRTLTGGSFHALSLPEQCGVLGIPLQVMDPTSMMREFPRLKEFLDRPIERFVLEYYLLKGWRGDWTEGASFRFIAMEVLKLAKQRGVRYHMQWPDHEDDHLEYDEIVKSLPKNNLAPSDSKIVAEVLAEMTPAFWQRKFHTCTSQNFSADFEKRKVTIEAVTAAWNLLGTRTWQTLSERAILGYATVAHGWPDLFLYKGNQFRFVEVKQTRDAFTLRQPYWLRNTGKPMGFSVSVVQISKSLRKLSKE